VKRALIVVAVLVLGLAVLGVAGQVRRTHREVAQQAATEKFAAAHPLEVSASTIDLARWNGQATHFALVPRTMPPGIVRMEPSIPLADNGVTDIYSYGDMKAIVNFTAVPSEHRCDDQPCVHDARLTVETADAPSLRHVVVWLTGAASPEAAAIRQFWAETAWVPTAQAGWFADLAARGWPGVRR
jgi:hypothetical protein